MRIGGLLEQVDDDILLSHAEMPPPHELEKIPRGDIVKSHNIRVTDKKQVEVKDTGLGLD